MGFKFFTILALIYVTSAARLPVPMNNARNGAILVHTNQNLENISGNAEAMARQDEYARNIDHSINTIQNDYYQQHSNRLLDNEFRRTNYFYAENQHDWRQLQQQQQQEERKPNMSGKQPNGDEERRREDEWYFDGQPTTYFVASLPYYRTFYPSAYNQVSFNSPLVSYRY